MAAGAGAGVGIGAGVSMIGSGGAAGAATGSMIVGCGFGGWLAFKSRTAGADVRRRSEIIGRLAVGTVGFGTRTDAATAGASVATGTGGGVSTTVSSGNPQLAQ